MLGLGVTEPGDGGINLGTGAFLMVNTGSRLAPAQGLMASVHYSREQDLRYLLEGSVNAAGDGLEWARKNLGLFKDFAEVDDLCWKAASDTVAFIGLNGTGAPHWEQGISSAFHGLGPESAPAELVRAIVEGVVFFLKDIAEEVRKSGIEPKNYVLAGGLAPITYLTQVLADILGTDLRITGVQEASSAMGAAFLAGMQHGAWTDGDDQGHDVSRRTGEGRAESGTGAAVQTVEGTAPDDGRVGQAVMPRASLGFWSRGQGR